MGGCHSTVGVEAMPKYETLSGLAQGDSGPRWTLRRTYWEPFGTATTSNSSGFPPSTFTGNPS